MKEKIKHPVRMLTVAVIAGASIGLTGCASTGQFEELQTKVNACFSWMCTYVSGRY